MKNTCLGFPIKKGRLKHRLAKEYFNKYFVSGLKNFRLRDYDKYNYKLGSLAHDCDGFNHYIVRIEPDYINLPGTARGKILVELTFYKEDGTPFCHVGPPRSKAEIEAWYASLFANREGDPWKFTERYEEQYGKGFAISENGTIIRGQVNE